MQTLNGTAKKKEKPKKVNKLSNDNSNSKSWFSNLKKSFGNHRKTKAKPMIDYSFVNNEIFKSNEHFDEDLSINKNYNMNFSNDFLDSFIQNTSTNFYNENLKSKLKNYQNKNSSQKHHLNTLFNSLYNYEQPKNVEQILMTVVEEYINCTCEKMLQDKMRSVHKKIQNWTKNSLARPGFKKPESIPGGNITELEKSFTIDKNSRNNKCEKKYPKTQLQEKYLFSHNKNEIFNDFQYSNSTRNSVCETIKETKSNKRYLTNYKMIPENFSNQHMNFQPIKFSEKNAKLSKNKSNKTSLINNSKMKNNISLKNSAFTESNSKVKGTNSNILLSEFTDGTSEIETIINNKSINQNCNDISICKYPLNNSSAKNYQNYDIEKQEKNLISKMLNISDVVNIDIKPLSEISSQKLFSRIPKFYTKLKSEKSVDINSGNEINDQTSFHVRENKVKSLSHIIRPKIRRSVTFLEPRQNILNSSLSKETGFISHWDIRSEVNKSTFNNTKHLKLSHSMSSNLSIPDLCDTHTNVYTPSTTLSTKSEYPSNLIRSITLNEISKLNDTIKESETEDCVTIKNDKQLTSFSPVIISLQSTPSFVGDINYPFNIHNSPDTSLTHLSTSKKSLNDKINSISETNDSIYHSENLLNILKFQTSLNQTNSEINAGNSKPISNSKNYSIIEIVNKTHIGSKSDENESSKIHLISNEKINKPKIPKFSKKLESVNTSSESSMTDEDVLISTGSIKSKLNNQPLLNLQEIDLSDDDHDDNIYNKSQVINFSKIPFSLSQMKTANFSSIGKEIKNSNEDSVLQAMKTSYLSLVCKKNNIENNDLTTLFNEPLINQFDSNNSKNIHSLEQQYLKKDKNHVLKHTVASKQKMRDKVNNKSRTERQPMKFSRNLSRIY